MINLYSKEIMELRQKLSGSEYTCSTENGIYGFNICNCDRCFKEIKIIEDYVKVNINNITNREIVAKFNKKNISLEEMMLFDNAKDSNLISDFDFVCEECYDELEDEYYDD